jgi:hypothetical protein
MKKTIEMFEIGTVVIFLHKNKLYQGVIKDARLYSLKNETLKYDIEFKDKDYVSDINSEFVFESKEQYLEYVRNCEVKLIP